MRTLRLRQILHSAEIPVAFRLLTKYRTEYIHAGKLSMSVESFSYRY